MDVVAALNAHAGVRRPARQSWMQGALCRDGYDPRLWHPHSNKPKDVKPAIEICNRCPSEMRCLEYALKYHEKYGIWGGKTEHQRKLLRQKIRRESPEWFAA